MFIDYRNKKMDPLAVPVERFIPVRNSVHPTVKRWAKRDATTNRIVIKDEDGLTHSISYTVFGNVYSTPGNKGKSNATRKD